MTRKIVFYLLLGLILSLGSIVGADRLDDQIRAAGSDLKVFCPATDAANIQWSALLYLNRAYGAEVYVVLFQPSPSVVCRIETSDDGQFHLARIGIGGAAEKESLIDSLTTQVFGAGYPDLALFEASSAEDSAWLSWLVMATQKASRLDSTALTSLEEIYIRKMSGEGKAVIFNDAELYQLNYDKAVTLSKNFAPDGPLNYKPETFRRYYRLDPESEAHPSAGSFLSGAELDPFRLPGLIGERMNDGPEKNNVLQRLESYRSAIGAAGHPWLSRAEKLKSLMVAYADISRLVEMAQPETGQLAQTGAGRLIESFKDKVFRAIDAAVGIQWKSDLDIRQTPFGRVGKLSLDIAVTGPREIELSSFKYKSLGGADITVDSISRTIQPHQRFYREYQIDPDLIDFTDIAENSQVFSIDAIVDGLTLNLSVPFTGYTDEAVALRFLPGYTFLEPFTEDQYTALAQPFDCQLLVAKPYSSQLDGQIKIEVPDGVVVGTFNGNILMPEGITSRYLDIHFAAGRSIGQNLRTIKAFLEVGGQVVAQTAADVRVITCEIPETRDIAFVPDHDGRLEDFLRIARVSFQPFTARSLIRAELAAYDLLIIGAEADDYYEVLPSVKDRLHEFVRNGGDILIMGQSFGWPHDIFAVPIYTSRTVESAPGQAAKNDHPLLNHPYAINTDRLLQGWISAGAYPAIINGGVEIISAGEQGSYLKVLNIGEGHVIYCGLPVLESAAELDIEAIHLMANLINFGYGK